MFMAVSRDGSRRCGYREANGDTWGPGASVEARGAEGAEGVGCGEGVPPSPLGKSLTRGLTPFQKMFSIFELKRASFGALWVLESRQAMSK